MIIWNGVSRWTTKFIGIKLSSCSACGAVRGKPSRMNDESGLSQVCGFGKLFTMLGTSSISATLRWSSSTVRIWLLELVFREYGSCWVNSQPRDLSSERIRRRIMASGTSCPDLICDSAWMPSGVRLRTLSRRRSPEEMAESWGNLARRRSAWVPLPTPGNDLV